MCRRLSCPFTFLLVLFIIPTSIAAEQAASAQEPFVIPTYPSRMRYAQDTYTKVRAALDTGERQRLIDLINTDPLICRSVLIRLLRDSDMSEQAREFASLFSRASNSYLSASAIEMALVEFLESATIGVGKQVLDSLEILIELEIALRRRALNDRLGARIGLEAPGIVDQMAEYFNSIGFYQGEAFCLYFKGMFVFDLTHEELPVYLEESRAIFEEYGNARGVINCLTREAGIYWWTERKEKAEAIFERIIVLGESKEDTLLWLYVHLWLKEYVEKIRPEGRLSRIKEGWEILKEMPGLPYFKSSVLLSLSGEDESYLSELEALIAEQDDPVLLARIYWSLFRHFYYQDDPRSIKAGRKAIELASQLHYDITAFNDGSQTPPVPAVSYMLWELSLPLKSALDFDGAREANRQALELLGNDEGFWNDDQANSFKPVFLSNIANDYRQLGEYGLALEQMQQIAAMYESLGETHASKLNYRDIAEIYTDLGDFRSAREALRKATRIPDPVFNFSSVLLAQLNLNFARYEEAFRWLEVAEEDFRKMGVGRRCVNIWGGRQLELLANIWLQLGDLEKALEAGQRAEQRVGGRGQGVLGFVLIAMERYDEGEAYFQQRLKKTRERNRKGMEAGALKNLGRIRRLRGKPQEAIAFLTEALEIIRALGNFREEQEILQELALAEIEAGDNSVAEARFKEALQLAKAISEFRGIWTARFGLGRIAETRGEKPAAVEHYRAAVEAVESVAGRLRVELHKASFLEDKTRIYYRLIGILGPEQPNEAFFYAERRRAQAYLDSVRRHGQAFQPSSRTIREKQRIESRLIGKQTALREQLTKPTSERDQGFIAQVRAELIQIRREHLELLRSIQLQGGAEAYREGILRPLQVEGVQARVLAPGRVLVEYVLSEEGLYAFVVDQKRCRFYQLPVNREVLERQIEDLLSPFEEFRQGRIDLLHIGFDVSLAHSIYREIFKPLEPALSGAREVIVVPDDVLHYLPFEILARSPKLGPADRRVRYKQYAQVDWLLRHYTISYAVSATSLDPELRRRDKVPARFLAFAEPLVDRDKLRNKSTLRGAASPLDALGSLGPIPQASREVHAISRLMRDRWEVIELEGQDANEKAFFQLAPQAAYLHFAVHSIVDEARPEYSALILAADDESDGFLQTFEILEAELNSTLVTLSSCETALGRLYRAEGLLSLKRAFLIAGAHSILVTLWSIHDSSADFMEDFYRFIVADRAPVTALRQAKLGYLEKTKPLGEDLSLSLSHPFFWAPFSLTVSSH